MPYFENDSATRSCSRPPVKARTIAFVAAALLGAATFARLGVWQLARLREREKHNVAMLSRLSAAPVAIDSMIGSSDSLRYRRARVSGDADYAHEALLVQRTHDGSPGVFLVTPVITPGSDSATIVVRGWVYSPDGVRIEQQRWHEGDRLTFNGYLDELPAGTAAGSLPGEPATVRRLQRADLARRAGRPVRTMYLWVVGDSTAPAGEAPARFTLPLLDDGPHRSYAIQWFSFAMIALVGAVIVVRSDRQQRQPGQRGADATATTS